MANPNGRNGASFERLIADALAEYVDARLDRRVTTGGSRWVDIVLFTVPNTLLVALVLAVSYRCGS